MVLDLQGGELLALQGAGAFLDAAEFLQVELSRKPCYTGGALAEDVSGFLAAHGFAPLTPIHDHGDTVFRKLR